MNFSKNYFITPPKELYTDNGGYNYLNQCSTFSHYNYYQNPISSYIKKSHFEYSLRLTKRFFGKCNVIDFGCADGIFLNSLSKYFKNVLGIEIDEKMADKSKETVKVLNLNNTRVMNNKNKSIKDLKKELKKEYHIIFLMEVLEHVGDPEQIYPSKVEFLNELFTLIVQNGIIIISVPKMVGIPFLIQRIILSLLQLHRETVKMPDLLRAVIQKNTDNLEKYWEPHINKHIGFNHLKLERYLARNFKILKHTNLLFKKIYVIKKMK